MIHFYFLDESMNNNIFIFENETVKDALKKLDITGEKVLLVVDEEKTLLGTLTDGDIRRFILKGKSIETNIIEAYFKNPTYIVENEDINKIKKIFLEKKIELIPVLNDKKQVINYILWDEIFSNESIKNKFTGNLSIPVVIMAGGKGKRLDPFTKILPKPLIPIGEKTIIEVIIDEFKQYGIKDFYFTLNYKGQMIESYFNSIEKDYNVLSIWEKDFYGTAGSLKLLPINMDENFIVSNCDIIVKANYQNVYDFHIKNESYLTIISSIQNYKIPYGVIEYKEGGDVVKILEKPEYTFPINTGVYVLNKKCLDYIPQNKYFDMPTLIESLIKDNKKVLMYPINEKDYIDIGQWEEYKKAIQILNV